MPTTPGLALPYPDTDTTPDVPYDLQQLAESVDDVVDFDVSAAAYFDTSWQAYGNGYQSPRIVARGAAGRRMVKLEGSLGRNAALAVTAGGVYTMLQLPVGSRPAASVQFTVPSGVNPSMTARVLVHADGKVQAVWASAGTFAANGGTGYISVDGVTFYATQ